MRSRILRGATVAVVAGLLIPLGTARGGGFWFGPKKKTCFPSCSPTFGYTPTVWSPWPVAEPFEVLPPAFSIAAPTEPGVLVPFRSNSVTPQKSVADKATGVRPPESSVNKVSK